MTWKRRPAAVLVLAFAACTPVVAPVEPSARTTASSSASSAPGSVAEAKWLPQPAAPSLLGARVERIVAIGGGFLAVGCRVANDVCTASAAWRSPDGVTWGDRIDLPLGAGESNPLALAAAEGPGGTVVGGMVGRGASIHAALWRSSGGDQWERVGGGDAFVDASVHHIEAVGQGFAAVGSGAFMEAAGFRAWSSPDGEHWTDATPGGEAEAFATGILRAGDGLIAWGPTCSVCPPETAWWSSRAGEAWRGGSIAPGLRRVFLSDVVAVGDRLVGVGSLLRDDGEVAGGVWELAPGEAQWTSVPAPDLPAGTQVERVLLLDGGLVATATVRSRAGNRTVVAGRPPGSRTWTELAAFEGLTLIEQLAVGHSPTRVVLIGEGEEGVGPVVTWAGVVRWGP